MKRNCVFGSGSKNPQTGLVLARGIANNTIPTFTKYKYIFGNCQSVFFWEIFFNEFKSTVFVLLFLVDCLFLFELITLRRIFTLVRVHQIAYRSVHGSTGYIGDPHILQLYIYINSSLGDSYEGAKKVRYTFEVTYII